MSQAANIIALGSIDYQAAERKAQAECSISWQTMNADCFKMPDGSIVVNAWDAESEKMVWRDVNA